MPGVPLSHRYQHGVKSLFAWCYKCAQGEDLETLIWVFGPDFPVPDLGAKAACKRYRRRRVQTRRAWLDKANEEMAP